MKVKILNIPFDATTQKEVLKKIESQLLNTNNQLFIATPNPEMVLTSLKNKDLQKVLQEKTDLNIPDGIGIIWAAKYLHSIQNTKSKTLKILKGLFSLPGLLFAPKKYYSILPERITGTDLMQKICASAPSSTRIFLLGAEPGIADKVKSTLKKKYDCTVVGTSSSSADPEDYQQLQDIINNAKPDILFVAFGAPKQEIWIAQNLSKLSTVKVAIGIGGAFDFISGHIPRAPKIMRETGLEWLFRLFKQPSRIKRIYNATVKFPLTVIKSAL